jgi:hypothetical protein
MRKKSDTFRCPNCFATFEKDYNIVILSSRIAICGEGIDWSGDLERDIDQIKRVVYCKACHGPIDFHALLRGHLDERSYPAGAGWMVFFIGTVAFMAGGIDFWPGVGMSFLVSVPVYGILRFLERRRLTRWRLKE